MRDLTTLRSDGADDSIEEERKALIAMLGKLYISANSKTERLQKTTQLVAEAIDGKVAHDAPSRNALRKLLSALSKALGDVKKVKSIALDSSTPGGDEGLTAVDEQIEGCVTANGEGQKMDGEGDENVTEVQHAISGDLFDGEEDVL